MLRWTLGLMAIVSTMWVQLAAAGVDQQIGDWHLSEWIQVCQDQNGKPEDCAPDGSNVPAPTFEMSPFRYGTGGDFGIACSRRHYTLQYLLPSELWDKSKVDHDIDLVVTIDANAHRLTARRRDEMELKRN